MKKHLILLTTLLMAALSTSARVDLSPSMYVGWQGDNGNEVSVDGWTAHFTTAWAGAASLWLQGWDNETESNVPADYSDYEYFVLEFSGELAGGLQCTLEDGTWGDSTKPRAQASAGDTFLAIPLSGTDIDLTQIQHAYIQNTDGELTFTLRSVWVGSEEEVAELQNDVPMKNVSLNGWTAWDAGHIGLSYHSSTGALTADFGEANAWSGCSKWLASYDASDSEFLVFEFASVTGGDIQAFIVYNNNGNDVWQKEWINADSNGPIYVKMRLDADLKNSIAQIGFQNSTDGGIQVVLNKAYWVKQLDHADAVGWTDRSQLTDQTRPMFANYGDFDYLVFDFKKGTPAEVTFKALYGGNLSEDPWWTDSNSDPDATADAKLVTYFLPLNKVAFKQLFQVGYSIGIGEEYSYDLKNAYYATTDYLTETLGYTEEQIANHIYQADYVALPLSELSFGSQDGYDYAGKVTSTVAADESELTVVSKDIDDYSVQLGWDYASASDDTRQKLTTSWTNMDYLVIDFTVPVANEYVGIDVSTEAGVASGSIDPLEKTIIIPIKEDTENAEAESLQMLLYLVKNSILHISEVYLASEDYLKDKLQSDDIPLGISFEGEEITIGSTGYATIYYGNHNYSLVLPYGVKGYDYGQVDGKLQEIDVIEPDGLVAPHRALVLKLEDGMEPGTYYLPCHPTQQADDAPEGSRLAGSDEACTTTSGDGSDAYFYKLSTKNGENVGFYWGDPEGGAFESGAHKAWLWMDKESGNAAKGYVFGDDMNLIATTTTSIREIAAQLSDAPAYNLSGQRVNGDFRGIIIQNGKKMKRQSTMSRTNSLLNP